MIAWLTGAAALGLAVWYRRERRFRRTHPMAGGLHAERTAMTEHQHPLVTAGTSRIVTEKARNADFRRALYAP